jgi:hypothetical protein
MSELPICTAPCETWLKPVPEPPPCTVTVAPEHFCTYIFEAASASGWIAVEPAAVIVPVTQLNGGAATADPAGAADVVAAVVAGAPVELEPVVELDEPPLLLLLQAAAETATRIAAPNSSLPGNRIHFPFPKASIYLDAS